MAVIGHRAWERLFAASPDALGRMLALNGVSVTVVGVAPEGFTGVNGYGETQLWMPLAARDLLLPPPPGEVDVEAAAEAMAGGRVVVPPSGTSFRAAARLRPGVNAEAATAAVQGVIGAWQRRMPSSRSSGRARKSCHSSPPTRIPGSRKKWG